MTFDEWWKDYDPEGVNMACDRNLAKQAWEAGVCEGRRQAKQHAADLRAVLLDDPDDPPGDAG